MDLYSLRNTIIQILRPSHPELREASVQTKNLLRYNQVDKVLMSLEDVGRISVKQVLKSQADLINQHLDDHTISQAITQAQSQTRREFVSVLTDLNVRGFNAGVDGLLRQAFPTKIHEEAYPQYLPGTPFVFGAENPQSKSWIEEMAAKHVTNIDETTRARIAALVKEAYDDNTNYTVLRKKILNEVDPAYGMDVKKPQHHIIDRAHLIAVTELRNAHEEGSYQGALKLDRTGMVKSVKSWQTVGDNRVSAGCSTNSLAGWQPLDYQYSSPGTYDGLRAPRFPGCRCTMFYDTDTVRKDVDFTVFSHDGAYTVIQNEPVFSRRQVSAINNITEPKEAESYIGTLGVDADIGDADIVQAKQACTSLTVQKKDLLNLDTPYFKEFNMVHSGPAVKVSDDTLSLNLDELVSTKKDTSMITKSLNPVDAAIKEGSGLQIYQNKDIRQAVRKTYNLIDKPVTQLASTSPAWFFAENYAAYKMMYGNELPLEILLMLEITLSRS